MILSKYYLRKIFTEDEFEKLNYVGRHSAARIGRGFQTRPAPEALYFVRPNGPKLFAKAASRRQN